jgi:hypothetical protein
LTVQINYGSVYPTAAQHNYKLINTACQQQIYAPRFKNLPYRLPAFGGLGSTELAEV